MTNTAEIEQAIRAFLEKESPAGAPPLDAHVDLLNEWFVDSLMVVSTVAFLEERFGISFRPADISAQTFQSLATLTDYTQQRMGPPTA